MEERSSQLVVVVGASSAADELRRQLSRGKLLHAGVTTHLRGLRELLVRGEFDCVLVCVSFDQTTMARHATQLRKLVADRFGFASRVEFVGLLPCDHLTFRAFESGCDLYTRSPRQAAKAIRGLARRAARSPAHSTRIPLQQNRCAGEPISQELFALLHGWRAADMVESTVRHD